MSRSRSSDAPLEPIGTYSTTCPVCHDDLEIPIFSALCGVQVEIAFDRMYLRRHQLTHHQHPGTPAAAAA